MLEQRAIWAYRLRWGVGGALLLLALVVFLWEGPPYSRTGMTPSWSFWFIEGSDGVRVVRKTGGATDLPEIEDGERPPYRVIAIRRDAPVSKMGGLVPVVDRGLDLMETSNTAWPSPARPHDEATIRDVRRQIAALVEGGQPRERGWLVQLVSPAWWSAPRHTIDWFGAAKNILPGAGLLGAAAILLVRRSRAERRFELLCRGLCPGCANDISNLAGVCSTCGRGLRDEEAAMIGERRAAA